MITSLFFLAVMFLGVPIGVCLCLAGIVYIFDTDAMVLLQSFPPQMFGGVDSYGLIAIPLFILIGEIMGSGGITRRLVDLAMGFVGAVRGGLAYVNVLANMMLASIIGSATAQVARKFSPKPKPVSRMRHCCAPAQAWGRPQPCRNTSRAWARPCSPW